MGKSPERVQLESKDLAAEKLAALEELFPGVVADGVVDAARIGELVGLDVAGLKDGRERYGLMWAGKHDAVQALLEPSRATLLPDVKHSVNFDTAENVFIEGDNFEVLKLLQKAYNDQVKLIYIDPPYNTGNDFVYNDDFGDPLRRYLEYTGQIDADGNRVAANVDASGRRHSGWLSMIYPRLVLARNLLAQDGAIFVSIDDNEASNLKLLLDEVFGQENFIAQMVWAAGRKNDSKFVSVSHEYMLVYARNTTALVESVQRWRTRKEGLDDIYATFEKLKKQHGDDLAEIEAGLKSWYASLADDNPAKRQKHYCRVDRRGVYFPDNISWPGAGGPKYEVLHPKTKLPVKVPATGWRFSTPERMQELLDEDRIHFGVDESTVPCVKAYLRDRELEVPYSVFYLDGRGATNRLKAFLGDKYFDNPKDEMVLQNLVAFASQPGDLVMDFFAGSGSFAHAVALQNAADEGGRRYIAVNLPEPTAEKSIAAKAGFKSVSDVTKARLKAVIKAVDGAKHQGLRIFTLGESNFVVAERAGDGQLELGLSTLQNPTFDEYAVAAEILVKEGVRLDLPWEWSEMAGARTLKVGELLAVLSTEITEEVVQAALDSGPRVLVFLEDGFAGRDAVKASAHFGCKQAQITMKTV